ncbi:MAG TPA: GAF domain-containing protein [Candidatus Binatia bacterium]|jgi:CheY-like chemotaxis protein
MTLDRAFKTSPNHPLRILYLDHNPDYARLIQLKLEAEGIASTLTHVEYPAAFISAIERGGFDLVLADYSPHFFEDPSVLDVALKKSLRLPVILIVSPFHEERAIELLRNGVTDYVLKSQLSTLVPIVLRSLTETARQRERAEQVLKSLRDVHLAMTSTADLPAILRAILEKIEIFLPRAAADVVLLDGKTGKLEPAVCHNIDESQWRSDYESADLSLERMILELNQPWIIRNIHENEGPLRSDFCCQKHLVSYLGTPLTVREKIAGVVSVFTEQEHGFSSEEIGFIETLATYAGSAVWNSRLDCENRRLRQRLSRNKKQIRKLVSSVMHAQDQEAKRMARILPDESGQLLVAVYIRLEEIASSLPAASKEQLKESLKLLDQVEDRLIWSRI